MSDPVWLEVDLVTAIQSEQLALFGGAQGVRDAQLLESALDRPRNKHAYGEESLPVLAAAYAFGIARNHAFVDGNKRTALLAIYTFLGLNDIEFTADEAEAAVVIEALAAGKFSEAELAAWIVKHVEPD
jgi:death on curing protein